MARRTIAKPDGTVKGGPALWHDVRSRPSLLRRQRDQARLLDPGTAADPLPPVERAVGNVSNTDPSLIEPVAGIG
jgi:hypothetical protein